MSNFIPKKVKFRKARKPFVHGVAHSCANDVEFGVFALKAVTGARLTSKHLETARRIMARETKRAAKIWIRVFPHTPRTKKPADVRMGSGKGSVEDWVALVQPGTVLFEMDNVSEEVAKAAFKKVMYKLPLDAKVVTRRFCKVSS